MTGDVSKASFTGKSIGKGGSLGREAATGRGGVIVLRELLELLGRGKEVITVGVQGFGNVGSFFGLIAEQEHPNWQLVAATDSSGGPSAAAGLSAAKIDAFKKQQGRLNMYPGTDIITNDEFIGTDVDVLVLAALGDVITEANMHQVKAKIVLELANGPVNDAAYEYLTEQGVLVVPDIIANAGGVVVSYLEWLQNKSGERWTEATVNQKLDTYLVMATKEMHEYGTAQKLSLKESAFTLAIRRILDGKRGNNS